MDATELEATAASLIAAVLDVLALVTRGPFHKNFLLKEETLRYGPFRRCLSIKDSRAEITEEIHMLREVFRIAPNILLSHLLKMAY
jgi:hypothetical protein